MLKISFIIQMFLSNRLGIIILPFRFFTHGDNSACLKFVLKLYEVMHSCGFSCIGLYNLTFQHQTRFTTMVVALRGQHLGGIAAGFVGGKWGENEIREFYGKCYNEMKNRGK